MRKAPVGKPNSDIGPPLALLLLIAAIVALVLNYFGINPF